MDHRNKADQDPQKNRNTTSTAIQWVKNEVVYLFVGVWNVLRRFISIIVAIGIIMKIASVVVLPTVCQFSMARLFIGQHCSSDKAYYDYSASNKLVPIGFLFEKSKSLAGVLASSGLSAPSRMIESQLGITEVIITLRHSKIDSLAKEDLLTHFTTLQQSTRKTADELFGLVAVYDTVLDDLQTYAENVSKGLTQAFSPSNPLTDDKQNLTERSVNGGISSIENKLGQLLQKAQNAHCHLQGIEEELVITRGLIETHKADTEDQLEQLGGETFSVKLYRLTFGDTQSNKMNYERNWKTLSELTDFVRLGMVNTQNVLIKLKTLKNDAAQVEETVSGIRLQSAVLEAHIGLLKKAVNRLEISEEAFRGKRRLNEGSEF